MQLCLHSIHSTFLLEFFYRNSGQNSQQSLQRQSYKESLGRKERRQEDELSQRNNEDP